MPKDTIFTSPNPCAQCGGPVTDSSPARALRKASCSIPCKNIHRREGGTRRCLQCGKDQPKTYFKRYLSGNLTKRCNDCYVALATAPSDVGSPAPHPCLQCGKPFKALGAPCRVKFRKFCSRQCVRQMQMSTSRACLRCGDILTQENGSEAPSGRLRRNCCKNCYGTAAGRSGSFFFPRPSPKQMILNLSRQAKAEGVRMQITLAEARSLSKEDCAFCGGSTGHWIRMDPLRGFTVKNIRPACRPCLKLHKALAFPEFFLHAQKILGHTRGRLPRPRTVPDERR